MDDRLFPLLGRGAAGGHLWGRQQWKGVQGIEDVKGKPLSPAPDLCPPPPSSHQHPLTLGRHLSPHFHLAAPSLTLSSYSGVQRGMRKVARPCPLLSSPVLASQLPALPQHPTGPQKATWCLLPGGAQIHIFQKFLTVAAASSFKRLRVILQSAEGSRPWDVN